MSSGSAVVPILAYHQVQSAARGGDLRPSLVVEPGAFERQMSVLRALGYRTIHLDELASALMGRAALPARAFVVTFDDGYAGAYEFAFPILRNHGFVSTFFLIAEDFARSGRSTTGRAFPIMTEKQVNEMLRAGYRIGSHSLSHPRLTGVPRQRVEQEVVESKGILEDRFGQALTAFCYPYGNYDSGLQEMLNEAGYTCACTTRFGKAHRPEDRFTLKRIAVGGSQGFFAFLYRLLWAREAGGS